MHVGQFPKDLESREINLLFVWGLKKQACLEKYVKLRPLDYTTFSISGKKLSSGKDHSKWLAEGLRIICGFQRSSNF